METIATIDFEDKDLQLSVNEQSNQACARIKLRYMIDFSFANKDDLAVFHPYK